MLCAGLTPSFASTAVAEDAASPFIVDVWGNEEGLPQSAVISIIQSRDGYLWLGTLNGLVRFDGNQFTVFNRMNTPGLSSDRIAFLYEDQQTNLWVGTDVGGLLMIRDGRIRDFGTPGSGSPVLYAMEQKPGDVVFATASGILHFNQDRIDVFANGGYPLSGFASRTLVPSKNGLWQLLHGTVRKWQANRVEQNFGPAPWGNGVVAAALEDDKGRLVVGTHDAGVFIMEPDGRWRSISVGEGLSSVYILSLCQDREGNYWVGTDGGGLDRIKNKTFTATAGLPAKDAQSLSADADGGFWTAFNAGGIAHWNENGLVENYAIGTLSNAWTVLVTRQQQVWAGSRNEGLFRLDNGHFTPVSGPGAFGSPVSALFEDSHGTLWVGDQNGLAGFDGNRWKRFTRAEGLPENAVQAIAEDATGNLWIGTANGGLFVSRDGKISPVSGSPAADISSLCADKDGTLWVGSYGHGLARMKDGKWKSFSTKDGLAGDSISYIFEDGGYLWIGSFAGLMRVQKQALNDYADGKGPAIFCRTYGKGDGLPIRECSIGSQPSVCRTGDGRLWFPTTKGVASLNPVDLKPNLQPPVIMIESILVDGGQQKTNFLSSSWPASVTVAPGGDRSKVQLEIHYTALNFSAPNHVRFRYQLEGYQNDWTDAGNERVVRYPKLSPGKYRFNLVAYNEDGVRNTNAGALEVIVLPQYWQTAWFRVTVALVLLAMIITVVRYLSTQKLQRQLQAHKQREVLEHERSRIARDLHDQLGANLTQVALLGEMAEADKDVPDEVEAHAQQIAQTARETTRSLDEIVWAVNPANDTLDGLTNYSFKYAQEFLGLAGVRCRVDAPAQVPSVSIPPEVRHNVFLAFKEAVNNVVKHSQATEVYIRLRTREAAMRSGIFILEIEDNGHGVKDLESKKHRSGLRNMRKRMEDIGGSFEIGPRPDGGTVVRLIVPILS